MPRRIGTAVAAMLLAALVVAPAAPVRAADIPTTVTATGPTGLSSSMVGLSWTIAPAPPSSTIVQVWRDADFLFSFNAGPTGYAGFGGQPAGLHTYEVRYLGGAGYAPSSASVPVQVGVESVFWFGPSSPGSPTTLDAVSLTATLHGSNGTPTSGTIQLRDPATGDILQSQPVTADPASLVFPTTRFYPAGYPIVMFDYLPGPDAFATTDGVMFMITDDGTMAAHDQSIERSSVYPVKDGYRDTVAVQGTLDEVGHVVMTVRRAGGKVVRTADLGWRQPGPYTWRWNGRDDDGDALAAGDYVVKQSIADAAGHAIVLRYDVRLSRKALAWHTATVTLDGEDYDLAWPDGDGSVSRSRSAYAEGVRIRSDGTHVGIRYPFRLHDAVAYGPITFRVLGRSPNEQAALAGLRLAAYPADGPKSWDWLTLPAAYGWHPGEFDEASHRDARRVYGGVLTAAPERSVYDVRRVQLVYRWATLE